MTFKDLREASGMNLTRFSEYFNIPYRTLQHWEYGTRACPDYLMSLIEYKLRKEGMITMTRYELRTRTMEFSKNHRYEIKKGAAAFAEDGDSDIIKSFATKEEAIEALKAYVSKVSCSGDYFNLTEYWIEENKYDEDGEWVEGGDIWDTSKISIEIIATTGETAYEVITTADSVDAVEKKLNDLEQENEGTEYRILY